MRAHTLALAALLLAPVAGAQPTFTLSGVVAVPQGEFDSALGSVGGGLSAAFLYRLPDSPVSFGVEGTGVLYGYESRRVPFSYTIPDVAVDVSTVNSIATGLAVLRVHLPGDALRPYVDGVAGASYLWTQTSVEDVYDNHPIASATNYDDAALVYGGGVGLQARLGEGTDDDGRRHAILLDARVRYLVGSEATYLGRGDIDRYNDGTIGVFPRRSRTTMLVPQLGVTFEL